MLQTKKNLDILNAQFPIKATKYHYDDNIYGRNVDFTKRCYLCISLSAFIKQNESTLELFSEKFVQTECFFLALRSGKFSPLFHV